MGGDQQFGAVPAAYMPGQRRVGQEGCLPLGGRGVEEQAGDALGGDPLAGGVAHPHKPPAPGEPATSGAAGYGNHGTNGVCAFTQTLVPGQVIVLYPAGALYTAIGAGDLRAYVQGRDNVGHQGLSN